MVFARSTGDDLASLVKKIDSLIANNADKKMASFVNILGKNADEAGAAAEKFAKKHDFKNVVICAAKDLPDGPDGFDIAPEADVTVMTYVNGRVRDNRAFAKGQVDSKSVVKGTKKVLN